MDHAVDRYFCQAYQQAVETYVPPRSAHYIEQNIGLKAHVQRAMPIFLTLRDGEGTALVTAMLPPAGKDERAFRPIVVGFSNGDPYPEHGEAIRKLGEHFRMTLDPARYPTGASEGPHARGPPRPQMFCVANCHRGRER
jgi:hypothetical protein